MDGLFPEVSTGFDMVVPDARPLRSVVLISNMTLWLNLSRIPRNLRNSEVQDLRDYFVLAIDFQIAMTMPVAAVVASANSNLAGAPPSGNRRWP